MIFLGGLRKKAWTYYCGHFECPVFEWSGSFKNRTKMANHSKSERHSKSKPFDYRILKHSELGCVQFSEFGFRAPTLQDHSGFWMALTSLISKIVLIWKVAKIWTIYHWNNEHRGQDYGLFVHFWSGIWMASEYWTGIQMKPLNVTKMSLECLTLNCLVIRIQISGIR